MPGNPLSDLRALVGRPHLYIRWVTRPGGLDGFAHVPGWTLCDGDTDQRFTYAINDEARIAWDTAATEAELLDAVGRDVRFYIGLRGGDDAG